jgi:hypothetical protein
MVTPSRGLATADMALVVNPFVVHFGKFVVHFGQHSSASVTFDLDQGVLIGP